MGDVFSCLRAITHAVLSACIALLSLMNSMEEGRVDLHGRPEFKFQLLFTNSVNLGKFLNLSEPRLLISKMQVIILNTCFAKMF